MRIVSLVTALAITVTGAASADAATRPAAPSWAPFGTSACAEEDSDGPCYWDAGTAGNGRGSSFYVIPLDSKRVSVTYPFDHRSDMITERSYPAPTAKPCIRALKKAHRRMSDANVDRAGVVCSNVTTGKEARKVYRWIANGHHWALDIIG